MMGSGVVGSGALRDLRTVLFLSVLQAVSSACNRTFVIYPA
jgi:hypothetical protein